MKILVTGCTGYIGAALLKALSRREEFYAVGAARQMSSTAENDIFSVGEMDGNVDWTNALYKVDVVIHTAGIAHRLRGGVNDLQENYQRINVEGTLNLAKQAAKLGVKRLIYISSIGVSGVNTASGKSFCELDKPHPHNQYSHSKLQAERGLLQISNLMGLEVVIIRPPLVYGYDAPGNFGLLMNALRSGWLLPLRSIKNKRSFIALDNLIDFILTCILHEAAANEIFLISDGFDISTPDFIRAIAKEIGVTAKLIPFPVIFLKIGAKLLGRIDSYYGLFGSLQIDISKANNLLGWTPPFTLNEGIRRAAGYMVLSDIS